MEDIDKGERTNILCRNRKTIRIQKILGIDEKTRVKPIIHNSLLSGEFCHLLLM